MGGARGMGVALVALLVSAAASPAQQPAAPSYAKDVKPFLAKYCLECHKGEKGKGGLDVSTYAAFLKGGDSFPGFIPAKPDESFTVQLVEAKSKPVMPPKNKPQPTAAEKKLLRDWIAAGAKDDSTTKKAELAPIKPRADLPPPVSTIAYRPDGKQLAAGSRQRVVFVEPASGVKAPAALELPFPVSALAYAPDGKTLAVAAGAPGSAPLLFLQAGAAPVEIRTTHKDSILAVAFSPDGKLIATAGYDRLIKLWNLAGKEIKTLADHSDTIYGLAFSPDSTLLASGAADRAVKVWDVSSGKRLYSLNDATDWVYAVAWHGKQLAAGGIDKSIRVWEANAEGAKLLHSVFAHEKPVLRLHYAADGTLLYSLGEEGGVKSWDAARMTEKKVYDKQPESVLALAVAPDHKQFALGRYDGALVLVDEATGKPQAQPLPEKARQPGDRFDPVPQQPGNDSPRGAQLIRPNATIVGTLARAGAIDFYRIAAQAGQQIGVQAVPGDAKTLDPIVQLTDAAGKVVAEGTTALGHTCAAAGDYVLSIRDRDYRGGGLPYRLHVGEVPVVTAVFPLGLRQGTEAEIAVEGVHLNGVKSVKVSAPAGAAIGSRVPLGLKTPHGEPLGTTSVVVGEFAEVVQGQGDVIAVPGVANGRIAAGGDNVWQFAAKKGQRLIVDVQARRLGSPLDSAVEILDAQDKPVARATLRCQARTFSTFRDHDSATSGIRIETWNELAVNDYLVIGNELIRIRALPKNPDDDCQFFAVNGQRVGWLDTTPTHHPQGVPMYKVSIHPPGTTFPPNGFPVITLNYRNDDGGAGYGKDSRLFFDPPADGTYKVRVTDARGAGGSAYAYRLNVRPPQPGFTVRFNPTAPAVWRGGAVPVAVTADRSDGFDDAIEVELQNLPIGFSAPKTTIPAGETTTAFALFAAPDAPVPEKVPALKLAARARIGDQDVVREAAGGMPTLVDAGDIVTTVNRPEVTVKPGQSVKLTVTIERRNKFAGRVPLEVRGLPHGIRVLDIGLNGILVLPQDSTRTIEIYCEPWVTIPEHPIVVLARREGKNSEHAAKSVLLKVAK